MLDNFSLYLYKIARQFCLLGLVLPCLYSAPALAAQKQTFEHFSIDVLPKWTVHKDESVVTISHPQRSCALTIMVMPHQNVAFRELGIAFYQNFHGKQARDVDGGMTFDLITENNMPSVTRLSTTGPLFCAVTVMGQCEAYDDMVYSLRILDENKQPYVDTARPYPLLGEDAKKSYEAAKQALAQKRAQQKAQEASDAQKATEQTQAPAKATPKK